MFIALVIATVLLAFLAVNSAAMKLRQNEQVVTSIHKTVGVPMRYIPVLAALEVAGAIGIVAGLWLEPLGIAAAAGLTAYFLGAMGGHLRVGDTKGLAMPLVPLVLSVAVLVLRIVTA
ncbi:MULTISPECIES: DoxX family protein [unclassified Nocardioides]|uniref:DoxX family protein n=1 Tax=unclassified Nocardioides TaxID=2615069 RepID=UPI0000570550|nr:MULTISPECIES: DoxX family protein [unclassified Nocardioides]ABL81692.1 integral membrane protein [Nocardioides sp. JS614]